MSFELRPIIGEDQFHEATRLVISANSGTFFRRILFPDGMGQVTYNKIYKNLSDSAKDPDSHIHQLYDTEADRMAAVALWSWTKPLTEEEWDRKSEEKQHKYPEARQEIVRPFFKKEGEARKKVMGQRRWWELVALSVDLQYQRKGLGGRLMDWGIEELEREHRPSVIVSSQAGYELYLKYGFQTQEIWTIDLAEWGEEGTYMNAIMTRYPKGWGEADQVEQNQP